MLIGVGAVVDNATMQKIKELVLETEALHKLQNVVLELNKVAVTNEPPRA